MAKTDDNLANSELTECAEYVMFNRVLRKAREFYANLENVKAYEKWRADTIFDTIKDIKHNKKI